MAKRKPKKAELSNADVLKAASKDLLVARPYGSGRGPHGVPRHTNKTMYSMSVHPDQSSDFQKRAIEAGFKHITFTKDGKCHADSRREQHEYAYFRTGYVNRDGGYYETIKPSRMRELDRLAGRA